MTAMVCGICGGSGAGKSTLTRHLVAELGADEVCVLAFDAYYRDQAHLSLDERRACNYDHPDSLDHELFSSHLDQLRLGRDIDVPEYDFVTHTLTGHVRPVAARPIVIVEGILLLAFDDVTDRLDLQVFLDVPESVRLERRLQRDVSERGRDPDDVRRQFAEVVAPMHDRFVQPHRDRCDRIVRLGDPYDEVAIELARRIASSRVG